MGNHSHMKLDENTKSGYKPDSVVSIETLNFLLGTQSLFQVSLYIKPSKAVCNTNDCNEYIFISIRNENPFGFSFFRDNICNLIH